MITRYQVLLHNPGTSVYLHGRSQSSDRQFVILELLGQFKYESEAREFVEQYLNKVQDPTIPVSIITVYLTADE